jgi:glutamine synthetase
MMGDVLLEAAADLEAQLAALAEAGVRFVRVMLADLHGVGRSKEVALHEFGAVASHGLAFCQAVMTVDLAHNVVAGPEHGFRDIVACPDLGTLVILPWEPTRAWVLSDLRRPSREPHDVDPRGALRTAIATLEEHGFAPVVAPELEFYLCKPDPEAASGYRRYLDDDSGVYTTGDLADPHGVVRGILTAAEDLGLGAFACSHEFGRAQYEINLKHTSALESADHAFRFKVLVKELAAREGLLATFMGRPWNDDEGSGFHLHLSLLDENGQNAFCDDAEEDGLAVVARQFVAGVLEHAPALMAFLDPTVNAYRRIRPEAVVPTHANWGHDNRFCFVRVPRERGASTRIEIRVGDGTANPYLAYAACLVAGLDGIRRGLEPGVALSGDVHALPAPEHGPALPASLPEALDALEADQLLATAMGEELVRTFLQVKRYECERFRRWVTDWEFTEYSRRL